MKHTLFIFGTWSVFCVWVLFVCQSAYLPAVTDPSVARQPVVVDEVWGLPSWVFWGIAVPWTTASAVTILYALFGIREDPKDAQ